MRRMKFKKQKLTSKSGFAFEIDVMEGRKIVPVPIFLKEVKQDEA